MKILLLSRWFFPAKNPRAFRTTELVRELTRRGHEIDFFCPDDASFDDKFVTDKLNIYHISVSHVLKQKTISLQLNEEPDGRSSCMKYIKKLARYLLGAGLGDVVYAVRMYQALAKKTYSQKYDVLLVISYPFYLLVAAVWYISHNKYIPCKIADCGDPLYYNHGIDKAFYLKYVEKIVLRKFDWITIPMQEARLGYCHCDIEERLRVIPQGFRIFTPRQEMYCPNEVSVFCYAGVFYEKIRDPSFFFDFLCKEKKPFRFVVYALKDPFTKKVLTHYKNFLGEKLVVKEPIERECLIREMAKMDFVLNFDNDNSNQKPSKLIDYAMSRRPILSFNRQTFRPEVFEAFLTGDYSEQYHVDLEQYDIRHVVDQFEALFDEKTREEVK